MASDDLETSLQYVRSSALKIKQIWNDVGLSEEQINQRSVKMWKHVYDLFHDIQKEETKMYENIVKRVEDCEEKVMELSNALQLKLSSEYPKSLLQKLKSLENEMKLLTEKKKLRMKHYEDRKHAERKLCDMLNVPPLDFPSDRIPNQDDLNELQQHIRMLEQKVKQRLEKFQQIKARLTGIMKETDYIPSDVAEKEIILQPDNISLSDETFKILERALEKAENQKEDIEFQRLELIEKLNVLWQRLRIEENHRKKFLAAHSECRWSSIAALEEELRRCERIKNENLKGFIESLREELRELWKKCRITDDQRRDFDYFKAEDLTDSVLEAHEAEVDKWKIYYNNVKHILTKIERWTELFNSWHILEQKANDPGRYKNRGGKLLEEEKERKKIHRNLPALEAEISDDIAKYDSESGSPFRYDGQDFKTVVANRWNEIIAQKENDKILRKKQHLLQMQHEVTVGTPAKRPMPTTPKSAPMKLFKQHNGLSLRTPLNMTNKKAPSTISKLLNVVSGRSVKRTSRPNAIRKCDQDRILRLRNTVEQASASPNTTSYNTFACELNRTLRSGCRSSVLATRKPGGTRASNTRKSGGSKSVRKSLRNKSKVANPTPTKMHIGIPFII